MKQAGAEQGQAQIQPRQLDECVSIFSSETNVGVHQSMNNSRQYTQDLLKRCCKQ